MQALDNGDGTVTISYPDWKELIADQRLLDALRGAGVDNWEGYDDVVQSEKEEDE